MSTLRSKRDVTQTDTTPVQESFHFAESPDESNADTGSSTAINLPRFRDLPSSWAHSARLAGRVNAAGVSATEHQKLLEERQALIDKELAGEITRKEKNRLEYVRWSLDRIEDAKHGIAIDVLDDYVSQYERFLVELQSLQAKLQAAVKRK